MPAGTYEEDVQPIRGDVFLDRILGWLCLACALPIVGVAIYRLGHVPAGEPTWVQPAKVLIGCLGIIGIAAIITSKPAAIRFAAGLYGLRLLALVAMYPWSNGPRFWGTELVWDLTVIGYCLLRLKPESASEHEAR
jgi:hypothetical protein